ncbi:hypothetical protein KFL_000250160 [Klebsormidium nitens]|uniref:Uncharacterized protein n=1 Tax=Klebsormidium nitens TaxID=105231 RepID=A0A1Y1HPK2_KLENI|nr:hypothetical protein KFL_000250160 [Klebsormidium nitens]|eukprot:GAQ79139.1 hypothetical protein KFL_000250160 [Klebsormidium nitens]
MARRIWCGLALVALLCIALLAVKLGNEKDPGMLLGFQCSGVPVSATQSAKSVAPPAVLVSYSYFEKDAIQKENLDFFLAVGMGLGEAARRLDNTDFSIVVSGDLCTPCKRLYPHAPQKENVAESEVLREAFTGAGVTLLFRKENVGMDFAAHNVSIEWARQQKTAGKYKYFIFLNSSVRGPFFPSYMPHGWRWMQAYTDRFQGDIAAVSSSIVCLPHEDRYGPHLESWAFALIPESLELLIQAGVFNIRECKFCADGVIAGGEYAITEVLMTQHGRNVASLMSMYPLDTDWRDSKHWGCNNNVHPSRHGTYDGITMHPFEVVFVKASWHVGEPFVERYSEWSRKQAEGEDTTSGSFDNAMFSAQSCWLVSS